MDTIRHDESVMVFTRKGEETLLNFNGTDSWSLDPSRVSKCKYVICVCNARHPLSEKIENHGEGFLVGKISGVTKPLNGVYPDRFMIEFDEYAEIQTDMIWKGKRNPVSYIRTKDFKIDLDRLDFQRVPERDMDYVLKIQEEEKEFNAQISKSSPKKESPETPQGLSIADAKLGLSIKYEIPVENIEIIMKG